MKPLHRFRVQKLVRDGLNARMKRRGGFVHTHYLPVEEYAQALRAKLIEECQEVLEATSREERLSELADVLEVIRSYAKALGASIDEVEVLRMEKLAERGGFNDGLFCNYVEVPEGSDLYEYYKAQPERYPEIETK